MTIVLIPRKLLVRTYQNQVTLDSGGNDDAVERVGMLFAINYGYGQMKESIKDVRSCSKYYNIVFLKAIHNNLRSIFYVNPADLL